MLELKMLRSLSILLLLALFVSLPTVAQQNEELTIEEARALAAELRHKALDEARLKELEVSFRLRGGDPESAARLTRQVREFFEELDRPVDLPDMSLEEAERGRSEMTEEQSRRMGEQIREFYVLMADWKQTTWENSTGRALSERSSCYSCSSQFDLCLNLSDRIYDNCVSDSLDPQWCLTLYRSLLTTCVDGISDCLDRCAV